MRCLVAAQSLPAAVLAQHVDRGLPALGAELLEEKADVAAHCHGRNAASGRAMMRAATRVGEVPNMLQRGPPSGRYADGPAGRLPWRSAWP